MPLCGCGDTGTTPEVHFNLRRTPGSIEHGYHRDLADFGAKARKAIDEATRLGDADTADLFTGISRENDKYLWFLEAHLHGR